MAGIRSRHTRPERVIRSELHRIGYRFRLHSTRIAGHPDLVLPKYRVAVHIHGCFWHGHDCSLFKVPGIRRAFWARKFEQNRLRDFTIIQKTLQAGWRHLTVWECAFRGPKKIGLAVTVQKISAWVESSRKTGVIRSRR
jgi:DNA mismatch endonuclease (patch repair protein)